jgi:hypothetical protein
VLRGSLSYWAITWSHLAARDAERRICRTGRGRDDPKTLSHRSVVLVLLFLVVGDFPYKRTQHSAITKAHSIYYEYRHYVLKLLSTKTK